MKSRNQINRIMRVLAMMLLCLLMVSCAQDGILPTESVGDTTTKASAPNESVTNAPESDKESESVTEDETTEADTTTEASGETETEREATTEKNPNAVPDFIVYDINGNEVKLSDFFGKPIVLNFWASWCGPCKNEMPAFNEKCKELEGEVVFLMINLTDGVYETVKTASSFIASKGYTFPVYYDKRGSAANAYDISAIPTTFFIDAQGNLVAQTTGSINAATLQAKIDLIR